MFDYRELENVEYPINVAIMEILEADASNARLYEAGFNIAVIEINSLNDVPRGYEIVSIKEPDDANEFLTEKFPLLQRAIIEAGYDIYYDTFSLNINGQSVYWGFGKIEWTNGGVKEIVSESEAISRIRALRD